MEWEVFYAPHTDDESIGMAGAIARARAAGRSVLVCLVTDNAPSARGQRLFPAYDLARGRRIEWQNAMDLLDVTELKTWEIPEANMETHLSYIRSIIRDEMIAVHQERPVVHHHTTWGMWDHNQGIRCLAHELCASAAFELSYLVKARVSLYSVYEYSKPKRFRTAPTIQRLTPAEFQHKRDALKAYYPSSDSIGYGYSSVPELLDAARTDPREFVINL